VQAFFSVGPPCEAAFYILNIKRSARGCHAEMHSNLPPPSAAVNFMPQKIIPSLDSGSKNVTMVVQRKTWIR